MSNITLFFIVFVFLLMVGGWITSEIISNKESKKSKKFSKQIALLDKENSQLHDALTKETERYVRIKEEYDKLRDAKSQIRNLETEYKKLLKTYNRQSDGVEVIRQKVSSKKYSSNSLAKEVIVLLDEHCPNDKQREVAKEEETRQTFKRIKGAMGMGPT